MKLVQEFIKLPFSFDVERLSKEVLDYGDSDWIPHPDGFEGNSSIPLLSVNGQINNAFNGQIKPTEALNRSPYLMQVIASFSEVFGRSRLMRLSPGCQVPLHTDTSYHWQKRVRIHIPIITDDEVIFHCGDKSINMAAGETWIFDSWKYHKVENLGKTNRVHLVIDTAGSSRFWNLVNEALTYSENETWSQQPTKNIPYQAELRPNILCEQFNSPLIMTPGEMDCAVMEVMEELALVASNDKEKIASVKKILAHLKHNWREIWSLFGNEKKGWKHFNELRQRIHHDVVLLKSGLSISNGVPVEDMLLYCVLMPAMNVELSSR